MVCAAPTNQTSTIVSGLDQCGDDTWQAGSIQWKFVGDRRRTMDGILWYAQKLTIQLLSRVYFS